MKRIFSLFVIAMLAMAVPSVTHAVKWTTYRIMLDPGHGGTDPGASGPTAPHEAELALRCAKQLNTWLTGTLGAPVKMTRTTNATLSLSARRTASINYDPYIFCSIHLNAFNGTANGTETWYYWSTGNSKPLAQKVQATLISQMNRTNRGVKQNGWTVITGSSGIPAILTEGLFVDNKTEHNLIKTEGSDGFLKWARGHLYGFYDHLKTLNSSIDNPRNIAAISGSSGSTTTTPTLKVVPGSLVLTTEYAAGVKETSTFEINGTNLTDNVTISSNNAKITVSPTSVTKANAKSATVKVTFAPTAVGQETATITVKSGSLSKTVSVTATATAPPLKFVEKWQFSEKKGNLTAKGWDAGKIRNMAYHQGKLYLVYDHSVIKVVNAQTGELLGDLSTAGVSGGALTLCDVEVFGGKIYACNLATDATPLKIYRWDSDTSAPVVVMTATNFGGAKRMGDCMTFKGNETSGSVTFANDDNTTTRIVSYPITNSAFKATPTVVNATNTQGKQLVTGASTRVYANSDGKFWISGQHSYTSLLDATGKLSYYIDGDVTWGNDWARFKYESDSYNYALETVYDAIGETNYLKGRARLLQKGSNWKESKVVQEIPEDGMSDNVRNANCASSIATSVTTANNVTTVEAWISIQSQGVCYYISKGGKAPTYDVKPITAPKPAVTVTPATPDAGTVTLGESKTVSLKVKGTNLENAISVSMSSANASFFTVSETTLAATNGAVDKTVKVTYSPTSVGSHTATLKFTTKDSDGKSYSATATVNGKGAQQVVIDDNIVSMKQEWIYSEGTSNLSSAPWFNNSLSSTTSRDMALLDGKLYILNAKAWNTTPEISIVNAYTGAKTGQLNMSGLSGGESVAGGIEAMGGKLLMSNGARQADALKVYKWDSDASAPSVFLEDAGHGGVQVGELMSVSGDMTAGRLWFSNGTKIIYYEVTNGKANATPKTFSLTKDGAEYSVGAQKGTVKIHVNADGTIWVMGKDKQPTLFSADGKFIEEMPAEPVGGAAHGTSARFFDFGKKKYAAVATYLPAAQSLMNGVVSMVNLTDGTAAATSHSVYPAKGLGTTRNTIFQSSVCAETVNDGAKAHVWVMIPTQGIAMYSYDGARTPTSVDGIEGAGKAAIAVEGDVVRVVGGQAVELTVYSVSGAVAATVAGSEINVAALPAGVYVVKAIMEDSEAVIAKITR